MAMTQQQIDEVNRLESEQNSKMQAMYFLLAQEPGHRSIQGLWAKAVELVEQWDERRHKDLDLEPNTPLEKLAAEVCDLGDRVLDIYDEDQATRAV